MTGPFDIREDASRRRVVAERRGIGVTAEIRQGSDLRFDRLIADRPTLVVVDAGAKILFVGARSLTIRPGEAVFFLPGLVFDVINRPPAHGDYRARLFAWEEALIADFVEPGFATSTPSIHALTGLDRDFATVFDRAVEVVSAPRTAPDPLARHRVGELLLWLTLNGVRLPPATPPSWSSRLRRLLLADLAGHWTSARAADHLATGESTLRRRLAEEETSFGYVLADTRMTQAMNMILTTDLPIDRVALDVGYASPSRFAARFRHRFGCAPSELRGHRRGMSMPAPAPSAIDRSNHP
ncbi:MAG: helix-turn-helix transcriptional regulator [Hyphomicrobiales bacterium]|nr:helix-turn-helix transcriptional regulator [Hyphomicrobiales bacterium]